MLVITIFTLLSSSSKSFGILKLYEAGWDCLKIVHWYIQKLQNKKQPTHTKESPLKQLIILFIQNYLPTCITLFFVIYLLHKEKLVKYEKTLLKSWMKLTLRLLLQFMLLRSRCNIITYCRNLFLSLTIRSKNLKKINRNFNKSVKN